MSSGFDYSKWDKIDYGSSDEEGNRAPQRRPQVTTLNKPSKITRTADGEIFVVDQDNDGKVQKPDDKKSFDSAKTKGETAASAHDVGSEYAMPDSWVEKGSAEIVQGCYIYWSQDRYSVTLRVALPEGQWACHVTNLIPYQDRNITVGSTPKSTLTIRREDAKDTALLQGDFPHPIHASEGEDLVDWYIESRGLGKYMVVTVYKATPMDGMTIWWKKALDEMQEIPLDWRGEINSKGFQEAWDKAHEIFVEKQKKLAEDT